jgi:hypothetical protein
MFERKQLQILKSRLLEPRKFIQVILGPRQVGKTTLVKQFIKGIDSPYIFVSADDVPATNNLWIEQQWQAARIRLKSENANYIILIIDEIQKIQNWSEVVKYQWDKDTYENIQLKLVLLGSAKLTIQKGLTESLAGRFEIIAMPHWDYFEMQEAFDFTAEQFVWFGGYPGAASLIGDEERWRDYILNSLIETTISKDILMLTRIDKPILLKRLFELGCAYSGQILSYTKLLGQIQDAGNTTTLAHYLNLLDATGLISGLEKYSHEKIRQRASSPKFQVQNNALFSVMCGRSFSQSIQQPSLWGRHIETAIGTHLLNASKTKQINIYYWRERNDEMDFVLEKNSKIIGIEVKSGNTEKKRGIEKFKQLVKPDHVYFISNSGLSWQEFLKMNVLDLF